MAAERKAESSSEAVKDAAIENRPKASKDDLWTSGANTAEQVAPSESNIMQIQSRVAAWLEHAGKFWNGRIQIHEWQRDTGSDGFKSAVPKRQALAVTANEMSLRITGADFLQPRQIDVESNLDVCWGKLGSTPAAKIEASSSMR